MSDILKEMLGKGTEVTIPELLLMIADLEKRVSFLENKGSYGGVYVDGSPDIVRDYYTKFLEKDKNKGGEDK